MLRPYREQSRANPPIHDPMEEEHFFTCPYCWQTISMLLDLSVGGQQYVEDCEVCCRPIEITYAVEDEAVASFEAEPIQDA